MQYVTKDSLVALYLQQLMLQSQLVEAQQQIIELQKRLDASKPETPSDDEVIWHVASGGKLSHQTAESDDLEVVQEFLLWNLGLANKYVKPYVSPKVFAEVVNQMTRGLPERIAYLKTRKELFAHKEETAQKGKDRIIQLPLIQDAK